jgi:hypothetical protein
MPVREIRERKITISFRVSCGGGLIFIIGGGVACILAQTAEDGIGDDNAAWPSSSPCVEEDDICCFSRKPPTDFGNQPIVLTSRLSVGFLLKTPVLIFIPLRVPRVLVLFKKLAN